LFNVYSILIIMLFVFLLPLMLVNKDYQCDEANYSGHKKKLLLK